MVRRKRSEVLVDDYLRRIAARELVEGDTLPTESELCRLYGVGRSAVREALQALAAKGFVKVRQGSGCTVAPRVEWNQLDPAYLRVSHNGDLLSHLVEAREILEPAIAAIAAYRASPVHVQRLRELAEELEQVGGADPGRHAAVDMAFHEALARATGNPVLVSIHASIAGLGRRSRVATAAVPGAVERAVFWHRHVVDAVAGGDPDAVRDAMRMHMRQVRTEIHRVGAAMPDQVPSSGKVKGAQCPPTR
ncbi:Fatty acid metabolism regulator protein [Actinoplanes sp. SE50]|uniref:FadR/GntR family transcriptional regulator n=1 Tax=unclassified Actinoplanes TaxID=2626549 RepID=UPI00023EBBBD|nr:MULTISPECIES: FadR/GntR family transcriptional regulator [unclassified Actinoplanes]AEV85066.1 Fatty acid metabolism regulator protein [Actinoplanes sp. SE50/110]ATO83457.1 Fatty acid metabolism regulator protein [Actinoplanes sp. SE50]SLM00864.1 GntR family transcriptional regulator [Actinoplanes sp. SE50/110]